MVHGDTATTFAAALAAYYQQIKVGHVEAGLRTGNIYSPWPEEANRQLISKLTNLHFAPTEKNRKNLVKEGVISNQVVVTGNTVGELPMYKLYCFHEPIGVEAFVLPSINNVSLGVTGIPDL